MKIAEMEEHHETFIAIEKTIKKMASNNEFPAVFSLCTESFPHIVPALKYRKKRGIEPETPNFRSFGVICVYGPPLFQHDAISAFLEHVQATRVLAKHENGYLQMAEAALDREESARLLWNQLAEHPGFMQRDIRRETGIDQDIAVAILDKWEELGIIIRFPQANSHALHLRSQLDAKVEGSCHSCGRRYKGRKEQFFHTVKCGQCGEEDFFFIEYVLQGY